jgi:hypothetical protein
VKGSTLTVVAALLADDTLDDVLVVEGVPITLEIGVEEITGGSDELVVTAKFDSTFEADEFSSFDGAELGAAELVDELLTFDSGTDEFSDGSETTTGKLEELEVAVVSAADFDILVGSTVDSSDDDPEFIAGASIFLELDSDAEDEMTLLDVSAGLSITVDELIEEETGVPEVADVAFTDAGVVVKVVGITTELDGPKTTSLTDASELDEVVVFPMTVTTFSEL